MRQIALQAHATSTRVKDSLHRLERLNMVQVKGPEGVFGRDVWRLNFADPRTARVLAILEEEA